METMDTAKTQEIEIKDRFTGKIIYAGKYADVRAAVEKAVEEKADLRGADLKGAYLTGADLTGAYLTGADLTGAYLTGAKHLLAIGPIGSRKNLLYIVKHKDALYVKAGCFWGTLAEFETAVEQTHGSNTHGLAYKAACTFINQYAKAYWADAEPAAAETSTEE